MKACYDPFSGMVFGGEEMRDTLSKTIVFAIHSLAICAENASEIIGIGRWKFVCQDAQLVAL